MNLTHLLKLQTVRRGGLTALAIAGSTLLTGCEELLNQLQAENMAVAVLTQTPPMEDPSNPGQNLPEAAAFTLTFSKVDKAQMTGGSPGEGAIEPIKSAEVKLSFKDTDTNEDVVLNLSADSSGTYAASSKDSKLKVRPTPYTLEIKHAGKTHKMTVTPPAPAKIKEFETSKLIADHDAGAPLTISRDAAANPNDTPVAIINVVGKNSDGGPAYTNLPNDALGLVKFALKDDDWKATSFEIPGSTFAASSQYVVTMSTMAKGSQSTEAGVSALFTGSSFLAGTSDAGLVVTK